MSLCKTHDPLCIRYAKSHHIEVVIQVNMNYIWTLVDSHPDFQVSSQLHMQFCNIFKRPVRPFLRRFR